MGELAVSSQHYNMLKHYRNDKYYNVIHIEIVSGEKRVSIQ